MPRVRVSISIAIGLVAGVLCWTFLKRFDQGAGDFNWAIWAARDLIAGRNPYQRVMQLYPLTAALVGFPFQWLPGPAAGGIFYGLSASLLAFGLTRDSYYRLWVFLAYPFWAGLLCAQWPPLIMAAAFYPYLQWVGLAKPQLGLPVLFTNANRIASGIMLCILAVSVALVPAWPLGWVRNLGGYQHFYPLLTFPGMLLLLSMLRFRESDARLLLLMAAVPQRWFYDAFILWLIPKSRRELVWTVLLSWFPALWRWHFIPKTFVEVGRWAVIFFYLPMLVVVLFREKEEQRS